MITIVWRKSGFLIIVYVAAIAWIVGHWYDDHRIGNYAETGWICFYTAIVTLLHGLLVLPRKQSAGEAGQPGQARRTLSDHSLFFIPVIFWALIFGALSAYFLIKPGNEWHSSIQPNHDDTMQGPAQNYTAPAKRSVYVYNPFDEPIEIIFKSKQNGFYTDDTISANGFRKYNVKPASYLLVAFNMKQDLIYEMPDSDTKADTSRYVVRKGKDSTDYFERIITPPTENENDNDDAWIILSDQRKVALVEVTDFCRPGVTQEEVDKTDWKSKVKENYDPTDIIEPLKGQDPGKGKFTLLTVGDDLPEQLAPGERVFLLVRYDPAKGLTNEHVAKTVSIRVKRLEEQ